MATAIREVRAASGPEALLKVIDVDTQSHLPERRFVLAPSSEPMSGARRLYAPRPATVRTDEAGLPCALGPLAVESIREDWIVGPIGW